jgi:hypothetical protein
MWSLSSPAEAREEVFWSLAVLVVVLLMRRLLMRVFFVELRSLFLPWAEVGPMKGPRSRWTGIPRYPEHRQDLRWRFPSPTGCQEELLDPPDLGPTAAADRDVFWKSDRGFRFFPLGGLYRRRGGVRGGPGGPHHRPARARGRSRPLVVWPPCGSFPSPLRFSGSFGKFLDVRLLFRPIPRIFPV